MDVLSADRDWLQDGKKGSRLGKVDLGLLRSQEDVHQSLIALEPRTYLFSAEHVIVQLPRYPVMATIQAIAALFTCESLSLSLTTTADKANIVLDHLAKKVVRLELDLQFITPEPSVEKECVNISKLQALRTLKISPKMNWSVAEQLLVSLPNNLEILHVPCFSAELASFLEDLFWRIKTGVQTSSLHTIHIPARALASMESRRILANKSKKSELSPSARKTSYSDKIFLVKQKAKTLDDMCKELGITVQPCAFRDALAV
jgi:hypothetical protein